MDLIHTKIKYNDLFGRTHNSFPMMTMEETRQMEWEDYWSSKLNVSGLPTIIVFDGQTGKELQRVEGALMKNDLLNLARSHMN